MTHLLFSALLFLFFAALLIWGLRAPGRAVAFWPVANRMKVCLIYGLPAVLLAIFLGGAFSDLQNARIASGDKTMRCSPSAPVATQRSEQAAASTAQSPVSAADTLFAQKQRTLARERLEKEYAKKREAERLADIFRESALPENMSKAVKKLSKGVQFSVQVESTQGRPVILAESNFPEGTEFAVNIMRGKEILAAERAYLEKGRFRVGPLLYRDEALYNGTYTLAIRSVLWSLQAPAVRETIAKVKKLKGKYLNPSGRIEYTKKITITDSEQAMQPTEVHKLLQAHLRELATFKGQTGFHTQGFAFPPAATWREAVRTLEKNCQRAGYSERDIAGTLLQLGISYMHSKGRETPQSTALAEKIKYAQK